MLKGDHSFQNLPFSDSDEALILNTTIKVMVIDHSKDFLTYVRHLLESCSFEVTCVDHAADALRILSKKKDKFDLLLIDSELRHVDIHTFLRLTNNMDTLSTVMCKEQDDVFLLQAFKNGACRVFKKPLTVEGVMQARQHVFMERFHNFDEFKKLTESEKTEMESANSSGRRKDNSDGRKNIRNAKGNSKIQLFENNSAKKKACIEWTEELHVKFLSAVIELGEGRCFPKDILDAMGVPGLTRMQVASHLQKCRRDGWRFIGKRGIPSSTKNMIFSSNHSQQGVDSKRFGRMPPVATNFFNQEERINHFDATLSSYGRRMNVNHMNTQPFAGASLMNGFGFRNIGENFSVPSVGQGSRHHIIPQNQAYDDFFDTLKDMDGNASVAHT